MKKAERREEQKAYRSKKIKIVHPRFLRILSEETDVEPDAQPPNEIEAGGSDDPEGKKNRQRRRITVIFQGKRRNLEIESEKKGDAETQKNKKKCQRGKPDR